MKYDVFATQLYKYLKSLKYETPMAGWICRGKTDMAFGTPNGSWSGVDGFLFENPGSDRQIIIRSHSNGKESYVVLESVKLGGQLYNMQLASSSIFEATGKNNSLKESYAMTVGYGRRKNQEVKDAFAHFGSTTNVICSFSDENPDYEKITIALLKWAILRENVKRYLKEKGREPGGVVDPDDGSLKTEYNGARNQILYGPPGTGKTYTTINRALEIIGENTKGKNRKKIKELFDAKLIEGQIAFTTFHQSMSYEDFIEGIKPMKPVDGDTYLKYEVVPGIFKRICNLAKSLPHSDAKVDWDTPRYFKMSLGGKERPDLHDWLVDHNLIALRWGGDFNLSAYTHIKDWKTYRDKFIKEFPDLVSESRFHIQATYAFLHMKRDDIVVVSRGNHIIDTVGLVKSDYTFNDNGDSEFNHFRTVEWIAKDLNTTPERFFRKQISQMSIYEFYTEDIKKEAFKELTGQSEDASNKNFVLIIDEINRGNVSQIFGELITLIEEDKRLGNKEELKVTLPYSPKDPFGVPSNLFIIGTMNTADRSVEALDVALRRRFSFEEMPPVAGLIATEGELKDRGGKLGSIDLCLLLETINKRLTRLLDKDHQIGHSYFMQVDSLSSLKTAFQNKILPLFQEYFYGDYGKIGLILGPGFFERIEESENEVFAEFDGYDGSDFSERNQHKLKNLAGLSDVEFETLVNAVTQARS